ncbi:LacI family DNA-binding transcriptional regulator [Desulfovibrio litoralis]|uniref:Transcriptional regulator, LacI family n=1 Tax=Desulfovibrio litoralis DSM 11393 TaxID=1121455 RepID=A0A1M7TMH5_9BACT|nr:LacI family DNA-binding transcriptional regulator [Desulfovibrio litoralis]SHN71910.1 transcriptional regulator, LacI family [Desulfovibrio litoralis DSM 11393]
MQDKPTNTTIKYNKKNSGRITIKDVAVDIGVSLMTVSRALHSPNLVSKKNLLRIQASIKKLGYLPNRLAGSLSGASTKQIAVLIPSISNAVFSSMLNGLTEILEPAGFQILLGNFRYNLDIAENQAIAFLGWMPDAIVMVGTLPPLAREIAKKNNVPVVEILELLDNPLDINVGISHEQAGYASGDYLISCGYKNFNIITAKLNVDIRAAQRIKGFTQRLEQEKLAQPKIYEIDVRSSIISGRTGMQKIIQTGKLPDVVFCTNDNTAFGVLSACNEAKISVPETMGIMGFNGLDIALYSYPQITTTKVDMYNMGIKAGETIIARLTEKTIPLKRIETNFSIVPGATTKNIIK